MSPRRILAILKKDLRDAWRDGRIVVLLLMPIGVALIPTLGGTEEERPTTGSPSSSRPGGAVARELRASPAEREDRAHACRGRGAARALVADEDVDVAVRRRAGGPPRAESSSGPTRRRRGSDRRAGPGRAGARGGAGAGGTATVEVVARARSRTPVDIIGSEAFSTLFAILLFVDFVAMMVVPIQTAEELETGTFARPAAGRDRRPRSWPPRRSRVPLGAVGVGLTVVDHRARRARPRCCSSARRSHSSSASSASGCCWGCWSRTRTRSTPTPGSCSSRSIGLAVAVFFVDSGIVATDPRRAAVQPGGEAARRRRLRRSRRSTPGRLAWLVIAVWAVAGYALLARIASRREL